MRRALWLGGAVLALSSALVLAQGSPESLLPPGFDDPAPPSRPAPSQPAASDRPGTTSPSTPSASASAPTSSAPSTDQGALPASVLGRLPSIEELEKMSVDELDELLGLKPKTDIPPAARRSLAGVGVVAREEGGFARGALAAQPSSLVRATLEGNKGQLVSRWGHILLRRALASRMDTPEGMDPVEFAALRAALLNRMGEGPVARALVQDIDTGNYSPALVDAAFDAYLATADLLGICPVARIQSGIRKDPQWQMAREICAAFAGDSSRAHDALSRAQSGGLAPRIDVLLARRFAGAAGAGRRAITIEWNEVEEITFWRFALASALGVEVPSGLLERAGPYYARIAVAIPALPLAHRADAADVAAGQGILSSAAMVDLYARILGDDGVEGEAAARAVRLRAAYVAQDPDDRLSAMRQLWGTEGKPDYARQVLTAYAAARLPVSTDYSKAAEPLIASMLAAGLDANALRWGEILNQGSPGWGLLVLAQPDRRSAVSSSSIGTYIGNDQSPDQRKSRFLVAGLAGLGRIEPGDLENLSGRLDMDLGRQTRWSRMIDKAATVRNPALVALLAGLGMQGDGWHRMTPLHLYHIVSALNRVGLAAEARMIAAEAVARS